MESGVPRDSIETGPTPGPTSPTQGRAKPDDAGDFFSVGAPLHAIRAGYVKRRADDLLYETVISGRYAHVLEPDRSGKSSLVAATAARLENNGCKVAILDLAQIGIRDGGTDEGRWYYSIAYRLSRQLRIRRDVQAWWQEKSFLSNCQRLVEFYAEVVLQHVEEPIVVFLDEIQCIENLPYAVQLLASIRVAHNARATDPDFSRLSFVLLGECDPVSLVGEAELSPFNITQQITLDDFSRADLNIFATEINLPVSAASMAVDRVFYWTNGQPYLSQKLLRAIAREAPTGDIGKRIDEIAVRQIAGRAALHSEPHMSHIHRRIVNGDKRAEPLLNLYGKLRKGIEVPADLGSPLQRRLMAVGLVVIDEEGNLKVRNRLYESVFTARWANENQRTQLRVPVVAMAVLLAIVMIPFWYTQLLPRPYVRVLVSNDAELPIAREAYGNLRSFPGHAGTADNLYRQFLERRALEAKNTDEIGRLTGLVAELPNTGRLAEELEAEYWDRRTSDAVREEDRDTALLSSVQSLVLATSGRRQRAAAFVSDDYPTLLATLPSQASDTTVFDPDGKILTTASGAVISQWSLTPQGVQSRGTWTVTALEVNPLVRRVAVDRQGSVNRIGLTLNISHARLSDLRIRLIAPSGRAIEVEPSEVRSSSKDDIQIPAQQLSELVGEALAGTWSISIRDESLGVAGQLVGWTLKLNSQGAVEYFERGLNMPDPVERETDNVWFDASGRYVVARATQSDSARIWDLAFAEPVRAIAVAQNESVIGVDSSARHLVTATQGSINLWETETGNKVAALPVGLASADAVLTADRNYLFVIRRGDVETHLELWSLNSHELAAEIVVAGVPAHVAISAAGSRVAIADFDRAVRVWEFASNKLLGQFDLSAQPSEISLSADGSSLGVIYPDAGISLWNIDQPQQPILQDFGNGDWHIAFSPSGNMVATGRVETGFQVRHSEDASLIGPVIGLGKGGQSEQMLAFSQDEQIIVTGRRDAAARFWKIARSAAAARENSPTAHAIWNPSTDRTVVASPDGTFVAIGDPSGHVHIVDASAGASDLIDLGNEISFLGHNSNVRLLSMGARGAIIASAAEDNSVRVWGSDDGAPLPFVLDVPGQAISMIEFSPDAKSLAILNGSRLNIVESHTGELIAEFNLDGNYTALAYSSDGNVYIGGDNGALKLVSSNSENNWQVKQVWRGTEPIRFLRASPRRDYLILVDNSNRASQFILSEGRIAKESLQFPSDIQDVVFDLSGTRTYFRTPRWVHRTTSSISGLIWIDALIAPPPLRGAGIVFGEDSLRSAPSNRLYLPAAKNEFVDLVELNFATSAATGLFGKRSNLLREWQARISAYRPEES